MLVLLLTINLRPIQSTYTDVIVTKSGNVRGLVQSSSLPGVKVQKFLNIPYAQPPVGPLRFEKPRAKIPWNETLNSTERNIPCFQQYTPGWNTTEDCLVLNIWTRHPRRVNATVMVYFYGGTFTIGSSGSPRHNGANFVAVGDVVLVTVNYRVSALGFLSTGDERIKGNLGLYDQRLAMKWVRDNIAAFGGNSDSITLFGLSAGAACVSAHTLSEESWPYFDRVILQSGNMLMPWTVIAETDVKAATYSFLKAVNCTNDENVLECLKTNVTHAVLERVYNSRPFLLQSQQFSPSVDGEFLKDHPRKLFSSGKVKNSPIILGITKDEMFYIQSAILWQTRNITILTQRFKALVRSMFKDKPPEVSEYAIELYSPECTPTFIEAFRPTVDIWSDTLFACPVRQEAMIRSKMTQEVYLYRYSYPTPVPYSVYPRGQFGFAAHAADFLSSFGLPINNPRFPEEDQILSMRMILYWTNFAKTGNPNSGIAKLPLVLNNVDSLPTWPPHSTGKQEFLDMRTLSRMVVCAKLREKYCHFIMDPVGATRNATTATKTPKVFNSASSLQIRHFFLPGMMLLAHVYNIVS